jgi:hypothetical protein
LFVEYRARPSAPWSAGGACSSSPAAGATGTRSEIAGDKDVSVASASIARQALDLGLLDEVTMSLVPVLMGEAFRTSPRR